MSDCLTFTVPLIGLSKKNSQQIRSGARGLFVQASEGARMAEEAIALCALAALPKRLTRHGPAFGDNYVAVRLTLDEDAEQTTVEIQDLGPQPKTGRRHTRRDVHNVADVFMDALQGIAFRDDRQARLVTCRYRGWEGIEWSAR